MWTTPLLNWATRSIPSCWFFVLLSDLSEHNGVRTIHVEGPSTLK